jgi:uncharacterized protein (DUF1778 family)
LYQPEPASQPVEAPATTTIRSARLGLRATPEQEMVLGRAAEATLKSLTDFVLDAAWQAE